mgnify:CR=1 FL=1|tara:strand:- start:19904 stop:20068 length:165 start_codon:yes stop_codon:yes gene_type:complete
MEEQEQPKKQRENNKCIFPPCPKCEAGYLLPFSYQEDVFEKWKCSECGYVIEKR